MAYQLGDRVLHNGKEWVNVAPALGAEPGASEAWEESPSSPVAVTLITAPVAEAALAEVRANVGAEVYDNFIGEYAPYSIDGCNAAADDLGGPDVARNQQLCATAYADAPYPSRGMAILQLIQEMGYAKYTTIGGDNNTCKDANHNQYEIGDPRHDIHDALCDVLF